MIGSTALRSTSTKSTAARTVPAMSEMIVSESHL